MRLVSRACNNQIWCDAYVNEPNGRAGSGFPSNPYDSLSLFSFGVYFLYELFDYSTEYLINNMDTSEWQVAKVKVPQQSPQRTMETEDISNVSYTFWK